jgi:hypothetical protein
VPYIKNATHGMINANNLPLCKKNVHLLNFARGEIIDGEAVKEMWNDGRLTGARRSFPSLPGLPLSHFAHLPHLRVFALPKYPAALPFCLLRQVRVGLCGPLPFGPPEAPGAAPPGRVD